VTTLIGVPTAGTPKQTLRVEKELWEEYGEVCKQEGVSRAADLRAHMEDKVARWKANAARRES